MFYKEFQGLKLSALGMGMMRMPVLDGESNKIDVATATEMVAYAMAHGVNYYDTAWPYHGGQSEPVMGKILSAYPRESFYLASKFPGYDAANMGKAAEIFAQQLERCCTDHFDFYLLHNVSDTSIDNYLNPEYGVVEFFLEQKKAGRIRHLGFSSHASIPNFRRFLAAHGKDMEFCQIQLNWLDWTFQDAKQKVEILGEYGLPVWVMEPVRGGKLAKVAPEYEAKLKALRDESVPAWAFRFIQSIPTVGVTLSGMSNMEQLKENIATYEECKPLNDEEKAAILEVAESMKNKNTVPCTACRYCTEKCPQKIDIPVVLDIFNSQAITGSFAMSPQLKALDKLPSDCLGCHSCESVCPQGIKIADTMSLFASKL